MKKYLILMSFGLISLWSSAQGETDIKQIVNTFAKAGDLQDTTMMSTVLHPAFEVLFYKHDPAEGLTVLPGSVYLNLMQQHKIGGDQRTVRIHHLAIEGDHATVVAAFKGKKADFHTTLLLVKTKAGDWKIIRDFPHMVPKKE